MDLLNNRTFAEIEELIKRLGKVYQKPEQFLYALLDKSEITAEDSENLINIGYILFEQCYFSFALYAYRLALKFYREKKIMI